MAKVSARGAAKICSVTAISPADYSYMLTMCSDGRVLIRPSDGTEGYKLYFKTIGVRYRNMDGLRRLCKIKGLTITHEAQGANGRMVALDGEVFGDDFCTITTERFRKSDTEKLYALNIMTAPGHSIGATCLSRKKLQAIYDVIGGFLEEEK